MSGHVSIDFETWYSKKLKVSLRSMIAETYVKHDAFDPYLIAVHDAEQSWCGNPRDFNWDALEGRDVVAHNMYFEASVIAEMKRRGWIPDIKFKSLSCTADMSAFLVNRRALDAAAEKLLGVKVDKSAREDAADKTWPKDFSSEQQKVMLEYAARDSRLTWELWDKFSSRWPRVERELSRITREQGLRGVQINTELLDNYLMWTHDMKCRTEKELPWLKEEEDGEESWDGFSVKPSSVKCVAEQCRRSGIPCPPVKSESEEDFLLWETTYSPAHKWIPALSSWRSVNKLLKTFQTMKARLRSDGSMPFALLYFGAHTGRWSGTARINFQNLRKEPVMVRQDGLMETNESEIQDAIFVKRQSGEWPHWVLHAIDIRALIIPRPGRKMIVSDLSQIEPRVLCWLAGDTQTLDLIRGGMNIYEVHARLTMGWTGGTLKDEDPGKYKLAKARILACGYGVGWERFISMAKTLSGLDITQDDPEFVTVTDPLSGIEKQVSGRGFTSKAIVKSFRDGNKKIVGLWKTLDESMKRSVGEDFQIELPNGRKLTYEKVRCERRIEQDPETKLPRSRSVFTVGVGGFKRVLTYGGKLTENITQATARDVLGEHMVAADAAGFTVLYNAHDELVIECDPDRTAEEVKEIMSVTPEWISGCPISAEAFETPHYCK